MCRKKWKNAILNRKNSYLITKKKNFILVEILCRIFENYCGYTCVITYDDGLILQLHHKYILWWNSTINIWKTKESKKVLITK